MPFGFGDDFLDVAPKARSMKARVGKLEFIKIKHVCSGKETVKRVKTNLRLEDLCKTHIWWKIAPQNLQRALQQKENKQLN